MSCQHQSLAIERKVIRANGKPQPGDENRVCAYWNADERIAERVFNGDASVFMDRAGKATPVDPHLGVATCTEPYMRMTRDEITSQQLLLRSGDGTLPRADDIGWILAQKRAEWPRAWRRLAQLGHPMAAVVATKKGRDLETLALTASTAPGMFGSWGTNPSTLTHLATDVALFAERTGSEARTSVSPTQQTTTTGNDTWQYQFTITATGTVTIAEVGLFSASTQPAQAAVAAAGVVGSNSNTTLNTSATFSPGNFTYVQIRTEFMQITAGTGTTALTVVRMTTLSALLGGGSGSIATIAIADVVTPGNPPALDGTSASGATGLHGVNSTGGSGLIVADHTGDGLNTGDSIQYTIKDQLT